MGLYKRILKERAEERGKGRPLSRFRGSDSPALDRQLANAPEERVEYGADLGMLYRFIQKGPTNAGTGMQYMSLKKKYHKEYAELKAEAQG
jgi:hypothetical protein